MACLPMTLLLPLPLLLGSAGAFKISNARPKPVNRTFSSPLVDYVVDAIGGQAGVIKGPLGTLFGNCLPNTLDTTVKRVGEEKGYFGSLPDSFVITGDIPAMWLRDSMNQVWPYVRLLKAAKAAGKEDAALERFLFGTVHRQAASVLIDPYANAFAFWGPKGATGLNRDDQTFKEFQSGAGVANAMEDLRIFERKFEIDSLLSVIKLASGLHDVAPVEAARRFLEDHIFVPAVAQVLATLQEMTSCASRTYTFQRKAAEPTDTLSHGVGFPCSDTGMVRTHFRPSDDAVVFDFNVPGNAMAAVELARLQGLLQSLRTAAGAGLASAVPWATEERLESLEKLAHDLEASIRAGIAKHGKMQFNGEMVYAYEVDGFGNAIFMDDANVPSLLSLPFLGFVEESDPLFRATRRAVLSEKNPWYFIGEVGVGGVGGPHQGKDMIWPMSLMMQAWTSDSVDEVAMVLKHLMLVTAPNSLMHESFNKDDPMKFTRSWFAWANTLFGDLILQIASHPKLYRAANLTQPLDLEALIRGWQPKVLTV